MEKGLLIAYIFGGLTILLGINIILVGAVGTGFGNSEFSFPGFKRLYGLYPIGLGAFFIWAGRIKYKPEDNDKGQSKKEE
ncbi:MAG: hypothetical protein RBR53_02545 [Desulforegulaceae bacterium]|nr:hypothetical protein [Desulforegulaceae bacterium]